MRTVSVVCNLVLFAFTALVLVTDGIPTELGYQLLSLMVLLVPLLTAIVVLRDGASLGPCRPRVIAATLAGNACMLASSCWALVAQYPHPEEEGVLLYTVVLLLTPILSAVVLLTILKRRAPGSGGTMR
jgi:hypothetical protein